VSPVLVVALCVAVVAATPAARALQRYWQSKVGRSGPNRASYEAAMTTWFAGLFAACLSFVALGAYNPFIYFRF
jgi:hypothetical protein